jgi:hypothetical protein
VYGVLQFSRQRQRTARASASQVCKAFSVVCGQERRGRLAAAVVVFVTSDAQGGANPLWLHAHRAAPPSSSSSSSTSATTTSSTSTSSSSSSNFEDIDANYEHDGEFDILESSLVRSSSLPFFFFLDILPAIKYRLSSVLRKALCRWLVRPTSSTNKNGIEKFNRQRSDGSLSIALWRESSYALDHCLVRRIVCVGVCMCVCVCVCGIVWVDRNLRQGEVRIPLAALVRAAVNSTTTTTTTTSSSSSSSPTSLTRVGRHTVAQVNSFSSVRLFSPFFFSGCNW